INNGFDAFETICDFGSTRINRAGNNLFQDLEDNLNFDIGYKYLTLDKSNIKNWNSDFDNIENELDLFEDTIINGRSEMDIVFEIMLKNGLDLTLPISTLKQNNSHIYDIAFGSLFICLADEMNVSITKRIIEKHKEYGDQSISG